MGIIDRLPTAFNELLDVKKAPEGAFLMYNYLLKSIKENTW